MQGLPGGGKGHGTGHGVLDGGRVGHGPRRGGQALRPRPPPVGQGHRNVPQVTGRQRVGDRVGHGAPVTGAHGPQGGDGAGQAPDPQQVRGAVEPGTTRGARARVHDRRYDGGGGQYEDEDEGAEGADHTSACGLGRGLRRGHARHLLSSGRSRRNRIVTDDGGVHLPSETGRLGAGPALRGIGAPPVRDGPRSLGRHRARVGAGLGSARGSGVRGSGRRGARECGAGQCGAGLRGAGRAPRLRTRQTPGPTGTGDPSGTGDPTMTGPQ